MDNFHSTVLQRPQLIDDEERERERRHRDILNPAPPAPGQVVVPPVAMSQQPPPPRHSGFSLRSPTQAEFHHAPPMYSSPGSNAHQSPPRSGIHSVYMAPPPGAATGPPPGGLAPLAPSSSGAVPPVGSHQAPPHSPLHAPTGYYPPPSVAAPPMAAPPEMPPATREKPTTSSFYDPTTDTTRERRVSDAGSWHSAAQASTPKQNREAYGYSQSIEKPYYNGANYTSPVAPSFPPRSPLSHAHPAPSAGSISPPSLRHAMSSNVAPTNGVTSASASISNLLKPESATSSPLKAPSTARDMMSFSNILSNAEPAATPVAKASVQVQDGLERELESRPTAEASDKADSMTERETEDAASLPLPKPRDRERKERKERGEKTEKPARRSIKSRVSDLRESEYSPKPSGRRVSAKIEAAAPRVPAKRQVNGQTKVKTLSADKEKKIQTIMAQLDADAEDIDTTELADELERFKERAAKRQRLMESGDAKLRPSRREDLAREMTKKLSKHGELGKRRYDELFYEKALHEVRERELFAEKERKKDMQRKRRREKSMAVTLEQKEAAIAKAEEVEDEVERQRLLREAHKLERKFMQTAMSMEKGTKGPIRPKTIHHNLEGGTMSTFPASDAEPGKTRGKGRGGPRPKKSKEQKQLEKDSAAAAQAAIDAGEEPPSKEETKIRIKLNKKRKDTEVGDKDKENKEPKDVKDTKESREKEKIVDDAVANEAKFLTKGYNQIYDQILRDLARKDVTKTFKLAVDSYQTKASNLKKTAILASKEAKRWQLRTNKGSKDQQARAKRVMRDMMGFWKRNEREERDLRKAAEKQELENARKEEADREASRQKRKLNFLISQTELYSHFIGKKIKTNEVERSTDNPDIVVEDSGKTQDHLLDVDEPTGPLASKVTNFENLDFDAEDESQLKAAAAANAQNAIAEAQRKAREFNQGPDMDEEGEMNFQNPTGMGNVEIEQPKLINAQLKEYQLKGLNWLVNLYEQGINGILADEMGLGKTVQSISVMAYLAEKHDIWGPFLVVAPASTLHNWEQELRKFVPELKVLPYWGSAGDRKVLRKFWDRKHSTYKKEANFHVCVTSYQLVVSDVAYFQKMRWQYMILDEAQAIKSSQSSRWKCLLGFHCRNRLLLTGTPIQNNMQELWALLHFIMPSLFDSHDEFSEWFSKDIESHAQSNTKLNEDQLKRLHMILKPFMLRRVKKHVQKELGDKIELDVFCDLTYRQRAYYSNLRNQISIMDLIEKATMGDDNDSGTLMNLVMQFRKVCNHPDLFERADTSAPFAFGYFAETASFVREGNNVAVGYSTRSLVEYPLPRLVWNEGGRLYKAGNDNAKAGWRNKYLQHMMNIWTPENVQQSTSGSDAFSWLRFADSSPEEVYCASHQDVFTRAVALARQPDRLGYMNAMYDEPTDENFTPAHALFQIQARKNRKPLADITEEGILSNLMNVARSQYDGSGLGRLEQAGRPRASAPPIEVLCDTRAAVAERDTVLFNKPMRKVLFGPTPIEQQALVAQKVPLENYPTPEMYPAPDNEKKRFTNITVPSMRRFVTDSGKLAKLDELLFKLKNEGHRVLLYFQMTRMIDLMEEYLTYRNYKYCRLDGSTKLEDRRDTVADFQTRPEIFIFLLSTRAGGLGINLTSADTVIFYDSDWNPTIDSQAMDRAHRLGQTRQVTVYRLITRGTIEERIRKRALQKEEVQRVVIQGGGASVDFSGRRAPENRNRDIAMWLADDEQAEMIERREKELLESGEYDKVAKKRGGKRKRTAAAVGGAGEGASLDEMYHEGEGHFDDNKASGTATPVNGGEAEGARGAKKRKTGAKKAKTARQRLAMADGEVDG